MLKTSKKPFLQLWQDVASSIGAEGELSGHHASTAAVLPLQHQRWYITLSGWERTYLTRREVETLRLLQHHSTAAEVAQAMGLSRRTVECYVQRLRLKFQCASKRELVRTIYELNLFDHLEMVEEA